MKLKKIVVGMLGLTSLVIGAVALAGDAAGGAGAASGGIGTIAGNVTSNLVGVAKLLTAGSYVAGMAFVIGAIVKFKAHKDAPTQVTIGVPIFMLFVGAALLFVPGVFSSAGSTLFGGSASAGKGSIAGSASF